MFTTFATQGVAGIWEYLKDQFSDLKETVIEAIKGMLITQVIEAGIKWLFSLLIPGAGFIKAIMAIKDLIVFFVEAAMMLIPAITEAILALAAGSVAGVAMAIEKGLSMLIALVINLFAKLIGLGGLTKKVMAIFKKIRKRVDRAIMKLLNKAKKAGRKLMAKLGIGGKEKPKNPKEHDEQVKAGLTYLHQQEKALDKDGNKALTFEEANQVAAKTKKKFAVFTSISPRAVGGKWVYHWKGSEGDEKSDFTVVDFKDDDNLSPEEIVILRKLPGGEEKYQEIKSMQAGGSTKLRESYAEVRTAIDALNRGQENIVLEKEIFNSKNQLIGSLDVFNDNEMIEVKSGDYSDKSISKLSGRDFTQFSRNIGFFKGTMKFFDSKGNRILPPKKIIYQFRSKNVSVNLVNWLKSKGVTEVKTGKN